ncbi:TAXI family TRAP transporter solute-binding subunit [Rhodoferax sp.]|uniref:TAXI family TRAP transporter solute-binding subunit n=1 Tax=Rhodoferax sp. TaxID=50421 RepID=UPI00276A6BCC|nr:TAXI family TRAP transporter solute-binding subunit [Rhodoferax sp.]
MAKNLRDALLSLRELLVSGGPFLLLTLALLLAAYAWLDPNPPKHVTLATGPEQSAYAEFGKRYAQALKAHGIEVTLRSSQGASDNLRLLREGQVDLAFVQGGSSESPPDEETSLVSLGSLFVEPIWLFYRSDSTHKAAPGRRLNALPALAGLRLNVGTAGSGVPNLMRALFEVNHMETGSLKLSRLEQTPATVAFLDGELDALVFASAPESPMVQMLLQTPGVSLLDFAQNEAYSRRLAFLTPVTLPRGVVDLARDLPPQDVRLVAPTTTLLARQSVHPAVLQLFSQASLQIHGKAGWFSRAREFPNASTAEFPLSREAERTLRNGVPLLQRYLPFSIANLMERMWLALGLIVAIILPLSRVVPPLYQFRMRSRVFRWYGQLRDIEDRMARASDSIDSLRAELLQLQHRVEQISVPLSYADELYALRNHIEMVRAKLFTT